MLLQLELKEVMPPYKPQLDDDYDLQNFDQCFTDAPVDLSPVDE